LATFAVRDSDSRTTPRTVAIRNFGFFIHNFSRAYQHPV
jgi:hypothetical protein